MSVAYDAKHGAFLSHATQSRLCPCATHFCFLVAALRPCQGRLPRRKYMSTYPSDSRSSRRDCTGVDGANVEHAANRSRLTTYYCPPLLCL